MSEHTDEMFRILRDPQSPLTEAERMSIGTLISIFEVLNYQNRILQQILEKLAVPA